MIRDPQSTTQELIRYSYSNPPDSKEAARSKIQELEVSISVIEADLEYKEVESFSCESNYEDWRKRAIRALAYCKSELRFLEMWVMPSSERKKVTLQLEQARKEEEKRLKDEKTQRRNEERRLQDSARDAEEERLTARVKEFVDGVRGRYTRVYSISNQPESPSAAQERYTFVRELSGRVEQEFSEVKAVGSKHGIGKRRARNILFPLHRFTQTLKVEESFLHNLLERPDFLTNETYTARQIVNEFVHDLTAKLEERWSIAEAEENRTDTLESRRRDVAEAVQEVEHICEMRGIQNEAIRDNFKRPVLELLEMTEQKIAPLLTPESPQPVPEHQRAALPETGTRIHQEDELDELTKTALRIRRRAAELAEGVARDCAPVYSTSNRPDGLEAGKARMERIAEARRRVQVALAEVTDEWHGHPLRRKDLSTVKRPLTRILSALEEETRILKEFVSSKGEKLSNNLHWKTICVAALTRAMLEGFKLTSEEQEVLKALLSELASNSSA